MSEPLQLPCMELVILSLVRRKTVLHKKRRANGRIGRIGWSLPQGLIYHHVAKRLIHIIPSEPKPGNPVDRMTLGCWIVVRSHPFTDLTLPAWNPPLQGAIYALLLVLLHGGEKMEYDKGLIEWGHCCQVKLPKVSLEDCIHYTALSGG